MRTTHLVQIKKYPDKDCSEWSKFLLLYRLGAKSQHMLKKVAVSMLPKQKVEEERLGVIERGMSEWKNFMKPEDPPGGYISWEEAVYTVFTKATVEKRIRTPGGFSGFILCEKLSWLTVWSFDSSRQEDHSCNVSLPKAIPLFFLSCCLSPLNPQ